MTTGPERIWVLCERYSDGGPWELTASETPDGFNGRPLEYVEKAAIAAAEARGYARGVEDAARTLAEKAAKTRAEAEEVGGGPGAWAMEHAAGQLDAASWIVRKLAPTERTANDASSPSPASNAAG